MPDGFRFVAGTRSDPPLSLARLRLRGELLELRGDDLRFAAAEMADFFDLHDVPLADDELRRLHELTEGWPAGAQLAAIALQRGAARDDFLEAFASTDRAVGDFLLSEVLASLPPELVEFLVETSVLDAFDAELCAAVTGDEEAAALLERLLAANLFVVPLDERAAGTATTTCSARSCGPGWRRSGSAGCGPPTSGRAGPRGPRRRRRARCGTRWRSVTSTRAGRILRAAIGRSMSMSEGADVAVRAVRLWLHEFGAAFVETDPAWVVELLLGLIALTGPDDAPAGSSGFGRPTRTPTGSCRR